MATIDMSGASKAPPARGGTPRTRAPKASIGDQRQLAVLGLFQAGQAACIFTKQYADAAAIGANAENISGEVATLAAADDKVAKVVDSLLVVGPYSALVMAVLPLAMQLAVNHKILPAGKVPGTTDPNVLSKTIEAEMKQNAADMLQAARLAEQEADARLESLNGAGKPSETAGANR
jgi:hypothetical protein